MIDGSQTPDARLTAAGVRRLMESGQGLQTKVVRVLGASQTESRFSNKEYLGGRLVLSERC